MLKKWTEKNNTQKTYRIIPIKWRVEIYSLDISAHLWSDIECSMYKYATGFGHNNK